MSGILTKIAAREITSRKGQAVLIVIGLMISTAVITGSLVVGDSMEQLVYVSTFENLDHVDQVLQASDFFEYDYFTSLSENSSVQQVTDSLAPVILLKCSIEAKNNGLRENKGQLFGFDSNILALGSFIELDSGNELGYNDLQLTGNDVIINSELADRLRVTQNDEAELVIPNPSFKLETVFSESIGLNSIKLNVRIKHIIDHTSLGRIQLDGRSQYTANIFMNLSQLQIALQIDNRINTVLISNYGDKYTGYNHDNEVQNVIESCLSTQLTYDDLGYILNTSGLDYLKITHEDVFFNNEIFEILQSHPKVLDGSYDISPIMTYFVNSIENKERNTSVNYSILTGLDLAADSKFGDFEVLEDSDLIENQLNLDKNEIILLNWTADQLDVRSGDVITIEYMVLDNLYNIHNVTHNFTIKYLISLSGKAEDDSLMPAFPGLEGKVDCVNWEPPFPIDLNRISQADREFWFKNSGVPKGYISLSQAYELWSNNLGSMTLIKINSSIIKQDDNDLVELKLNIGNYLNSSIDHTNKGFVIDPVKSDSLATASGMSIFPMMFITFSSVIILAGMVLIIVIFLIISDARKYEYGMLRSVGLLRVNIVKLSMIEGLFYGIIAGLIGSFIGLLIGWILVQALNTIWSSAVSEFNIPFYFELSSILLGFIIGFIITFITIYFTAFFYSKKSITNLIADTPTNTKESKRNMIKIGAILIFLSFFIIQTLNPISAYFGLNISFGYIIIFSVPILMFGILFFIIYFTSSKKKRDFRLKMFSLIFTVLFLILNFSFSDNLDISAIDQFFISGIFLVIFFVILTLVFINNISKGLIQLVSGSKKPSPVANYSLKNPTRKLTRTALTSLIFTLVTFLLVALLINMAIQQESVNTISIEERGGYDILGETAIPIAIDLDNRTERVDNNIDDPLFDSINITEIKMVGPPGGTCSNMNVRYPPRLLGVSSEFIAENKFSIMETLSKKAEQKTAWHELEKSAEENNGQIPILVDYNTLVWIYGGSLGDVFEINDEAGNEVELQVVGILENSIFGGTFIMSQNNLDILFPKTAEFQYLLIKIDPGVSSTPEQLAFELEQALVVYGLDASAIRQLILDNRAYERSFIDLFTAFLGLGLILGIVGLGVVMARNVSERRYEIGVLRTIGYTKRMILNSFILEMTFSSFLAIFIGVIVGILSSYIAFGSWTGSNYEFVIPWVEILLLMFIIYIITILSSLFPAYRAAKLAPSEALRKLS